MRSPLLPVVLLAIAGCTRSVSIPTQEAGDSKAAAAPESSAVGIRQRVQDPARASGIDSKPTPAAKLALDSEGLRIFLVPTGTSRAIPFGLGKVETLATLAAVQGAPPTRQLDNLECNASNAIWPDGLTVWFSGKKFVGWSVRAPAPTLATAGGLRVGATRAEVESGASVASIAESTLGEEFTAGGIGGLLESKSAHARVTNLWAGDTCIAR